MKVIVLGANSKATKKQCQSAFDIGVALSDNNYLCIHGGGCGVMLHTTLGMQYKNKIKGSNLTYIICPISMKPESEETISNYKEIYKNVKVNTINDRIGILIEESKTSNYIICYGGGLGTINELFAIMISYYDHPTDMPMILFCNVDASTLLIHLNSIFDIWNIPERPYMHDLLDKFNILSTKEIIELINQS